MEVKLRMSFSKYWYADLHSHFSKDYEISQIIELDDLIPNIAPKDLSLEDCSAYLCDTEGQNIIELRRKGEIISHFECVAVFTKQGEILPHANLKYVELAHHAFGYESNHLISNSYKEVYFLDPGKGTLKFSETRHSVLIGVPIHKRFNLTCIFFEYMSKYLIPSLVWKGFDVKAVFVGEKEDLKSLSRHKDPKVTMSYMSNDLGNKKNAILDYAKVTDVDFLLWIDSDDFFHPETIGELIEVAKFNGFWSAIKPFCFYDTDQQTFGHFEGYAQGHNLENWGMGSGRVFTKELLTHMSSGFSKGNRSMDQSIKGALQNLDIHFEERLLINPVHLPIGVKTAQNIWAAKSYNTTVMKHPKWLPYDIWEQIENLSFDED
tara:strand:+ start:1616 stop:2746 length:1131 start_codon:yes stop_codon:yes gene_type:complete